MASQHAGPPALELRDVVDAVLSKLDGVSLARSCCVCKLWNEAGQLDRLWQTAYESAVQGAFQRNTQAQLPALLEAAGGWRGLYKWHRRTVLSPKGRVWIDNGQGGAHVPVSVAPTTAAGRGEVTVGSPEVCGRQGLQTAASQQNFTWSPNGALVAHTLVYRSTAGILGSSIASAVMIVDVTSGRRVRVDLEVPYPPFYFHWSPCGTRLAMLSNWHHMQVALRIMEVPLAAFASPTPLEDPPPPNVVLASLGRPLFISWHPDGSTIVQAVNGEKCSFLDIDWALEQGQGREIAPEIEAPGSGIPQEFVHSLKAPLWLQDAEERHWLLLPETVTEWPGVEAMQGQVVLVAPFNPPVTDSDDDDGLSRYEALVSRPVMPKCTLGTFSTTQSDVAFAATRDASAIAWLTGRHEVFAVLRLPGNTAEGLPAYTTPYRVWPADGIFKAVSRDDVVGRPPIAMQWSPNGRRLLMLLMTAAYGGPQGVQKVQWVVWELLPTNVLAYMVCEQHHAPQEFVQSQASFFDSYAQAGTLWAPTSNAFCYSALPQGDEDHLQSDFSIYVQPVPELIILPKENPHLSFDKPINGAIVPTAPPPVRVAPGRSANWSPC